MDEQRINFLSRKITDGSVTDNELDEYNDWFSRYDHMDYHMKSEVTSTELKRRIYLNIARTADFKLLKKRPVKLWPRFIAAAVATIVIGVWFFNTNRESGKQVRYKAVLNDIAPGKNIATLTLANGKTINLSDAKIGVVIKEDNLAYNDGSLVQTALESNSSGSQKNSGKNTDTLDKSSSVANEQLTATTPRGGTYQIILPDLSRVWLNAASSIKFPRTFIGLNRRTIELTGEAYFEVSKDKKHPFVVKTDKQEVEVLGTHFNINSYTNEPDVKTTLLEGSVKVTSLSEAKFHGGTVLRPGQQASVNDHGVLVKNIDTELAIAWKNNQFIFESDDIKYVMRMVERWYNVKVEYAAEIPDDKFGGSISRYDNVSEVLKTLESTGKVKFKMEGRRIIVSK